MTRNQELKPIHPGEILREELLVPLSISGEKLAQELKVDKEIITEIIAEKRNITPDIALRLNLYFPQSAQFWLNCQRDYEKDCLVEIEKNEIEELKKKRKEKQNEAGNKDKFPYGLVIGGGVVIFLLLIAVIFSWQRSRKN